QPGRMFVFDTGKLTSPRYIINFPTKRHWRGKTRLEDIDAGLEALVAEIRRLKIRSIAIPPLGCGLGGRKWSEVWPRIESALKAVPEVHAIVFGPDGAPESDRMTKTREAPAMTPGRAALVGMMHRYLAGAMDPFITLLEVHKLMYFLQEAGQPLKLRYVKAAYGPYAENLRHALDRIEGHLISGYADGGDAPDKQLQIVPGSVPDATRFLNEHPTTRKRFDRVARLVEGFATPFGLELLSTVHWVATREGAATPERAIELTYGWGDRKRRFSPRQIRLAWDILRAEGWLAPASGARGNGAG
ncbi:MAG: type II toxin-antitoxin system antitoxin DNA ADP-ribosyl glycohydrolase DarG, partial [Dehalococcoidia bacterium]